MITLRERFLLMFAEYREVLDKAQKLEDECFHLRRTTEASQIELRNLMDKCLRREQEISDRLMQVKYGAKILLTPEQIAEGLGTPEPLKHKTPTLTPRAWVSQQQRAALQALDNYEQKQTG